MKADLLLRGAEWLEADADNPSGIKFDIATWGTDSNDWIKTEVTDPHYKWVPAVDCGTTACAMGIFAISGLFKDQGLLFDPIGQVSLVANGEAYDGYDAAMNLFDIGIGQAEYLFNPDNYPQLTRGAKGERMVAKRIREFVASNGHVPDVYDPDVED